MILHHKERINDLTIYIKTPLKYSDSFTFIPIRYKYKNVSKDIIFQTPQLFIPYGVKTLDNHKTIIDISFMNSENDIQVRKFYEDLYKIFSLFNKKYSNQYKVHSFLKETIFSTCMRCKIESSTHFYNQSKQKIKTIHPFNYGRFLLQLSGLWLIDNEIWFQWFLVQGQLETPYQLHSYSFIDDDSESSTTTNNEDNEDDKYKKMIKMGVPIAAVQQQKKLDTIPPPPPPPPPSNTTSMRTSITSRLEISESDLQSVQLKKAKPIEKVKIKTNRQGFEPPSKEELQVAIMKLKKN